MRSKLGFLRSTQRLPAVVASRKGLRDRRAKASKAFDKRDVELTKR